MAAKTITGAGCGVEEAGWRGRRGRRRERGRRRVSAAAGTVDETVREGERWWCVKEGKEEGGGRRRLCTFNGRRKEDDVLYSCLFRLLPSCSRHGS